MNRRRKKSEQLRNWVLVILVLIVAVLLVVIVATSPKNKQPEKSPKSTSASSVQPESKSEAKSSAASEQAGSSTSAAASEAPPSSVPVASQAPSKAPSKPASATEASPTDKQSPYYEANMPLLVNPTNKVPESYTPDVVLMGNGQYNYDRTANAAYNDLHKAAAADGISLWVVSAYRNHDRQVANFNRKVKEYEGMGNTAEQAYAATAQLIAVPGTSEHELGLALDLNSLETSFETTKAFQWLIKHCAEYGFILRYPKDKVDITQISYEPWHYRYVGSNHAKIIMEKGLCLEEYLSGDYQ